MRLGPSLGMVYRLRVLRDSQGGISDVQTGRRLCLCSCREEGDWEVDQLMQLLGLGSEVSIVQKLRLKVQVV